MQVATAAARLVVTKTFACGDNGLTLHADGGAAVEAEPAEPEDEDAESADGQVVAGDGFGFAVLVVFSDTGAEDQSADESGHAAYHMNGCGTGEIMEAKL